jgi:glutathione S-transferase
MLELYHFNDSVCAQKVRVVLAEKHLDWVPHHVDLMKLENLDPAYLKLNPNGVVPTLVHDGAVVIESSEIIEYLDEHFPDPPLRPADPGSLERMRGWIRLEDDTGLLAVGAHTMQRFIKPHMERLPAQAIDAYETDHPMKERGAAHALVARGGDVPQFVLDQAAADLEAAIARMEEDLATGPWLAGGTYSLAAPRHGRLLGRRAAPPHGGLVDAHPGAPQLPRGDPGLSELRRDPTPQLSSESAFSGCSRHGTGDRDSRARVSRRGRRDTGDAVTWLPRRSP